MIIKYKKLHPDARFEKAHIGDAGIDFILPEGASIKGPMLIPTGIAVEIPEGYVGLVRGRSSALVKKNIHVVEGTVDPNYRGEVKIIVWPEVRHSNVLYGEIPAQTNTYPQLKPGDSIAQLVVVPYLDVEAVQTTELSESDRGTNGFGSTDDRRSKS